METRLREEFDADLNEDFVGITDYKTELNQHEINCGACSKIFWACEPEYTRIRRAIDQGLDNPFICSECQLEYDELAHEER